MRINFRNCLYFSNSSQGHIILVSYLTFLNCILGKYTHLWLKLYMFVTKMKKEEFWIIVVRMCFFMCNCVNLISRCWFQVQEFEDKDTALLIDRYKYLDLYPCTTSELKAVGYFVSILHLLHVLHARGYEYINTKIYTWCILWKNAISILLILKDSFDSELKNVKFCWMALVVRKKKLFGGFPVN